MTDKIFSSLLTTLEKIVGFLVKNKTTLYILLTAGSACLITAAFYEKDLRHYTEKTSLQQEVQQLKEIIKIDSIENSYNELMVNLERKYQNEFAALKASIDPEKKIQERIAEVSMYSHIDGTGNYPDDLNYTAQAARKRVLIQQLNILLKQTGQEQKYKNLIRDFYTVPAFNTTYPNTIISDKYPDLFNTTPSKK
jgi:hypothetical protein